MSITSLADDKMIPETMITRKKNRLEVGNTIILAMATLTVTWCAYQGNLWGGIQTFKLAESNKYFRLAQESKLMNEQHRTVDVAVMLNVVREIMEDGNRVDFYLSRLRPEMANVIRAWLATDPFKNPAAPPHPFATAQYTEILKKDQAQTEEHISLGNRAWHEAEIANAHSDGYGLFSVVFSMIMFFCAIASKLSRHKLSSSVLLVCAIAYVLMILFLFQSMPIARK